MTWWVVGTGGAVLLAGLVESRLSSRKSLQESKSEESQIGPRPPTIYAGELADWRELAQQQLQALPVTEPKITPPPVQQAEPMPKTLPVPPQIQAKALMGRADRFGRMVIEDSRRELRVIRRGDVIEGWRVDDFDAKEVRLSRGGRQVTLPF